MYHLQILTPEEIVFDDNVTALIACGEQGYLGVLTGHAPLIVSLQAGILIVTDKNNKKHYYRSSTGFLEVCHNNASIIIEAIQPTSPVDIGIGGGV
jgi:F-type H+-transporting ATPase subunit epsilon